MPEWATQVEVDGPILFIDGQPFPWYTLGGVQTSSGLKNGLPTITVTIPVDGMITFGVPERIGETQKTATENRRRSDERLRAEAERRKFRSYAIHNLPVELLNQVLTATASTPAAEEIVVNRPTEDIWTLKGQATSKSSD